MDLTSRLEGNSRVCEHEPVVWSVTSIVSLMSDCRTREAVVSYTPVFRWLIDATVLNGVPASDAIR